MIDFEEKTAQDNNKKLPIILIPSLVTIILIIGAIYYYNDWNSKVEQLEKFIELEELQDAENIYSSLQDKFIKIQGLEEYYVKIQDLKISKELKETVNYFSKYKKEYGGNHFSKLEIDSISKTITLIEELESKYDMVLTSKHRIDIDVYKLAGLSKLILNNTSFTNSFGIEDRIANYDIYLTDSRKEELLVQLKPNIKKYETQAIEILEKLNQKAEELKSSGDWENEQYKNIRYPFDYLQFILSPTIETIKNLIGESFKDDLEGKSTYLTSSELEKLNTAAFTLVLNRLMGGSNSNSKLLWVDNQEISKKIFDILEKYLMNCDSCPYDDILMVYYLNSAGVNYNLLFYSMSSYNNLDLKTDKLKIEWAFGDFIEKAKKNKALGWFAQVMYKYAIFLHQTKQLNELAKLSNNLESLIEEVGLSLEKLNEEGIHDINPIMTIYYLDSNFRWDKKDYKAVSDLYEKIDKWLGLKNKTSDDILPYLGDRPSIILRNMWAAKVNLNEDDACEYLRKASNLNPEDYYDLYLKNCN